MGEVYLAAMGAIEGAERPCVVKIIRREHAQDKSFLARFLDEARIQAQLHHPGVAQILEAAIDDEGKPFVVVEHVEGRNLGEIRTRAQQLGARVSWAEAVAVGIPMAEGLVHVHERTDAAGRPLEIVHRDLSPQNVMLGYAGDVKLIDFGTARGENRRCHTVAGIVFAKPGYVAPEVANNTPGGVPADLYAFGIMLWELLAGRRFLHGEASEHMALVGAGKRNPAPIAQHCDAPPELDAIIQKLTATRIEDRYASAREALNDMAVLMKRAPSLTNGERSIRARISLLMQRLYPAEPARSRAEFVRLVAQARKTPKPRLILPPPSPTPPPTDSDPSVLSGTRYRLVREIGRGAMGIVYEACHVDLGRSVALKVLDSEASQSAASSDRLRAEARAIARIEDDNLVKLFDFGFASDGRAFYAMELLHGESLDRRLAGGDVLSWREAARIGVQVCRALEAAHAAGVVHRDIKPANLFASQTGEVKLLDFGVAKLERGFEADEAGEALVLVGTPEYMAPEQAHGGEADVRSDLYALGAVLYELVTGRLPFEAQSTIALLDAKAKSSAETTRSRAPQRGIPTMLDKTISQALEPNPDARFQSAEEMREALEAALREPEQKRRRRRRLGFAVVGVVLAFIAGIGGVSATKPEVRARAFAIAKPLIEKVKGTSGAAATEVAAAPAAAPAEPAAAEVPAAAEEPAAAPAEQAAADPAAADDESDDDGTESDNAGAKTAEGEVADDDGADDTAKAGDTEVAPAKTADAKEGAKGDAKSAAKGEAKKADDKVAAKTGAADDELFSAQPVKAASGDKVEELLAKAAELMQSGKKVKAFNEYRKIGRKHRKDARALKAWSEVAAQMKGYGEALRVAKQWANVDKSVEARIHLAAMQRKVGKREDAIKTLNALLQERPGLEEARSMLKSLSPEPRLAQR